MSDVLPDRPERPDARALTVAEAERRVRAGASLSETARALGVSRAAISTWAAQGRWRLKDLAREAAGLAPLPRPWFARDGRGRTEGSGLAAIMDAGRERRSSGEIEGLQAQAVEHYRRGRLTEAEAALRAADRLARLQRRVEALGPRPPTASEAARANVLAMTEAELRAEVRKLARAARQDPPG